MGTSTIIIAEIDGAVISIITSAQPLLARLTLGACESILAWHAVGRGPIEALMEREVAAIDSAHVAVVAVEGRVGAAPGAVVVASQRLVKALLHQIADVFGARVAVGALVVVRGGNTAVVNITTLHGARDAVIARRMVRHMDTLSAGMAGVDGAIYAVGAVLRGAAGAYSVLALVRQRARVPVFAILTGHGVVQATDHRVAQVIGARVVVGAVDGLAHALSGFSTHISGSAGVDVVTRRPNGGLMLAAAARLFRLGCASIHGAGVGVVAVHLPARQALPVGATVVVCARILVVARHIGKTDGSTESGLLVTTAYSAVIFVVTVDVLAAAFAVQAGVSFRAQIAIVTQSAGFFEGVGAAEVCVALVLRALVVIVGAVDKHFTFAFPVLVTLVFGGTFVGIIAGGTRNRGEDTHASPSTVPGGAGVAIVTVTVHRAGHSGFRLLDVRVLCDVFLAAAATAGGVGIPTSRQHPYQEQQYA